MMALRLKYASKGKQATSRTAEDSCMENERPVAARWEPKGMS